MKKIGSILFLSLMTVFTIINHSYALPPYEITQITHNDYWDYHPDINNNGYIVWDANDGGGYRIFQHDGSNITIIPDSDGGSDPRINNNGNIVWHDGNYDVWLYNGSATTQIGNGYMPDINDYGYVAWLDSPSGGEIFLYDGSSATPIADGSDGDSFPHINNNGNVVWHVGNTILLYDGSDVITIGTGNFPDINDNGDMVWGGAGIFFYDGSTTTQIATSGERPYISNNGYIVWYDPHGSTTAEIFLYDGYITTQMTNNDYKDYFPNINDRGDIVWQGYYEGDYEIFKAEVIPEPSSILLLSFGLLGVRLAKRKRS